MMYDDVAIVDIHAFFSHRPPPPPTSSVKEFLYVCMYVFPLSYWLGDDRHRLDIHATLLHTNRHCFTCVCRVSAAFRSPNGTNALSSGRNT